MAGGPARLFRLVDFWKDRSCLPLIAFQFPRAFAPDFPPETLERLASIPEVIGLKEASFDTPKTIETIATARTLPRKLGILTGSDTFIWEAMVMGCDGALIGFAGTATAELIEMQRCAATRDYERGAAVAGGYRPIALGFHTLRFETAALAAASAITQARMRGSHG